MTASSKLKPTSKAAWAAANDAGPHLAVLPTGKVVKFKIPDSSALLRAGRLPDSLREAALLFTSHPEGPEELMRELVITAAIRGPGSEATLTRYIEHGLELANHLVSEMLIEPEVTAEEIAGGMFHPLDIRMLLELAERLRNVDASGNKLPIITLDEWATFRRQPAGETSPADGGANGHVDPGAVPEPDDGVV